MGQLVPTIRTVCTEKDLCKAFIKGWQKLYNSTPSKNSIGVIVAQHNLETGSSTMCWSWNLGNVKYNHTLGDDNIKYCVLNGVFEYINGQRITLSPTDPGSWFRAFDTLDEGVEFYLKFLANGRYKKAWEAVITGDPASFTHLLKMASYYTAPESDYLKAEMSFFNQFMKSQSYELALNELNAPVVTFPIVHPEVDLTPSSPQETVDVPLTPEPTRMQKVSNFFSGLFKK